eukprot:COSAG02_NODE_1298_length_13386_cov_119.041921_8_plen_60_part_00
MLVEQHNQVVLKLLLLFSVQSSLNLTSCCIFSTIASYSGQSTQFFFCEAVYLCAFTWSW